MIKSNFKFLFLTTVIAMSFSGNLPAMQDSTKPKAEELTSKTEDSFIKEFVDKMKSDKIAYDGETLTLYAASSSYAYLVATFNLVFFTGFCLYCVNSFPCKDSTEEIFRLLGVSLFMIPDLLALVILCKNLHYDLSKVPFLIMNYHEIKFWNGKSIEWKDVDQISSFLISLGNYGLFKFYDKSLNVLFEMEDKISPISTDKLFSILEHYNNKTHPTLKDILKEFILKTVKEATSNEIAKPA